MPKKEAIMAACLFVYAWLATGLHAQLPIQALDSIETKVYFPAAKTHVDIDYMGNAERLSALFDQLDALKSNTTIRISRVDIVGYASPEGAYDFNQRLARSRAENLAKYLTSHASLPDSLISVQNKGIDWGGLKKAVIDSDMPYRDEVLDILNHEAELTYAPGTHHLVRSRKQMLMDLRGGRPWHWMMDNFYPYLRNAASIICYVETLLPTSPQPQPEYIEFEGFEAMFPSSQLAMAAWQKPTKSLSYPIMALRSNLLMPLLNVGLEVPVAQHWSVGADYYYPWAWPAKSNKNCFELIFVSAEVRYWLHPSMRQQVPGRNYLTGHSIGLYGAWGYYDFERNYHGHQGHGWSAGIDYVYSLPIAKGKLRLEFQLALGAVWSPKAQPYRVYYDGGYLFRTKGVVKNFFYLGPTKVGVSLVLPINRKFKRTETLSL